MGQVLAMASPFRVSATASRVDVFFEQSSFGRRFSAQVVTVARRLWLELSLVGFVGMIFAAVALAGGALSRGVIAGLFYALLAVGGFGFMIACGLAVFRALAPNATDSLIPRRIGFREDGIEVESATGVVTQERYVWLAGAKRKGQSIELSLAHDRPLFVRIAKAQIGEPAYAMLCRWLQNHGFIDG